MLTKSEKKTNREKIDKVNNVLSSTNRILIVTVNYLLFPLTEVVDDHRPAPTENQVLSMENFLPTRTQQVTILQPFVSVYIAQHENCDISKKSYKSIHKPSKVDVA